MIMLNFFGLCKLFISFACLSALLLMTLVVIQFLKKTGERGVVCWLFWSNSWAESCCGKSKFHTMFCMLPCQLSYICFCNVNNVLWIRGRVWRRGTGKSIKMHRDWLIRNVSYFIYSWKSQLSKRKSATNSFFQLFFELILAIFKKHVSFRVDVV